MSTTDRRTVAERAADWVAATFGSWRFVLTQNALIAVWMAANVLAAALRWDPYPFILLNLAMSWQAANATPILLMSQNRQAARDRSEAHEDFLTNLKAELEIEQLHERIAALHELVGALVEAAA